MIRSIIFLLLLGVVTSVIVTQTHPIIKDLAKLETNEFANQLLLDVMSCNANGIEQKNYHINWLTGINCDVSLHAQIIGGELWHKERVYFEILPDQSFAVNRTLLGQTYMDQFTEAETEGKIIIKSMDKRIVVSKLIDLMYFGNNRYLLKARMSDYLGQKNMRDFHCSFKY